MNIIVPMAGQGERFSKCGFSLPKPLISVGGKTMYRWAVDCLPLSLAKRLVFILRHHETSSHLEKDIKDHYADYTPVIVYDPHPQGQAKTVLESAAVLDLTQPTLVHNCDTWISPTIAWTDILNDQDTDGALVLFPSQEQRWSYAKLDEVSNLITDVQEKRVISHHASTGTYYFKDTSCLLNDIQTFIHKDVRENNEYYLSSVYRHMLDQGKRLKPMAISQMLCFGTPQDLVDSLNFMILHSLKV